jgi:hypothetical protein
MTLEQDKFQGGVFNLVFEELVREVPFGHLETRKTPFLSNGSNIYAGRDSEGFPHLLIPIEDGQERGDEKLSALTSTRVRTLQNENGEIKTFVDLSCQSSEADVLFAAMCFDLSAVLENQNVQGLDWLLGLMSQTIEKWRHILEAIAENSISQNAASGIIGEILALRALYETQGHVAWDAWVGQDRARHDFEFSQKALEVKTSTVLKSKECTIHGMAQLESAPNTSLYLVLFQIEWAPGCITVAELLTELEAKGLPKEAVLKKIAVPDTELLNPKSWINALSFKVVACTKYLVDENFPSITRSALNQSFISRISNVQYKIQLDGLAVIAPNSPSDNWMQVVVSD